MKIFYPCVFAAACAVPATAFESYSEAGIPMATANQLAEEVTKTCSLTDSECVDPDTESAPTINETVQASRKTRRVEPGFTDGTFGEPQAVFGDPRTQEWIDGTQTYMETVVMTDPKYESVRGNCLNRHEHCSFWAQNGECEANPGYMTIQCAPACRSCDKVSYDLRCPFDPDTVEEALQPGDVDRIFQRILSEPAFAPLQPKVVSKPNGTEDGVIDGPWMMVFDSFLTDEEADRLIELGGEQGYQRSSDVGKMKFDGTFEKYVNSGRTSMNSWCMNECMEDPVALRVIERIENVTTVKREFSENLQMLRYRVGEHYNVHHDLIPHQKDRLSGLRIFTLYMYLNTPTAGGGTDFPEVGVTVEPRKGRAALWPSVTNDDPSVKDPRTVHAALPVIEGVKYGANAWLHQRNFQHANKIGCQ